MRFRNTEFPPADIPHLLLKHRHRLTGAAPEWSQDSWGKRSKGGFLTRCQASKGNKHQYPLSSYVSHPQDQSQEGSCIDSFTQTQNHTEIQQPPHTCSWCSPSQLSQARIIESQVGINSRSCTWLGQKQLLQGGNVFFTQHFTLIRQCAATRDALDSRWQSFALNEGFGASWGEGQPETKSSFP